MILCGNCFWSSLSKNFTQKSPRNFLMCCTKNRSSIPSTHPLIPLEVSSKTSLELSPEVLPGIMSVVPLGGPPEDIPEVSPPDVFWKVLPEVATKYYFRIIISSSPRSSSLVSCTHPVVHPEVTNKIHAEFLPWLPAGFSQGTLPWFYRGFSPKFHPGIFPRVASENLLEFFMNSLRDSSTILFSVLLQKFLYFCSGSSWKILQIFLQELLQETTSFSKSKPKKQKCVICFCKLILEFFRVHSFGSCSTKSY